MDQQAAKTAGDTFRKVWIWTTSTRPFCSRQRRGSGRSSYHASFSYDDFAGIYYRSKYGHDIPRVEWSGDPLLLFERVRKGPSSQRFATGVATSWVEIQKVV